MRHIGSAPTRDFVIGLPERRREHADRRAGGAPAHAVAFEKRGIDPRGRKMMQDGHTRDASTDDHHVAPDRELVDGL
jgi:hypothetical protein